MRNQFRRGCQARGIERHQQALGQRQAGQGGIEQRVIAALRGGGDFLALMAQCMGGRAGGEAGCVVHHVGGGWVGLGHDGFSVLTQ